MSQVSDVIEASVPYDVTKVTDCQGDAWTRVDQDAWRLDDGSVAETATMLQYAPLTVTAVREPEPQSRTVRVTMALDIQDRDGKAVISTYEGEIGSCERQVFLDTVAETFGVSISAAADPSVLSLPTVPDGTTALIGARSGYRWVPSYDGKWRLDAAGEGSPGLPLIEVFREEGSVTVVMREPRTVDALTPDMELDMALLRGVSGRVWRREAVGPGWVTKGEHRCNIGDLFFTDGPLTEVFEDEPGGVS